MIIGKILLDSVICEMNFRLEGVHIELIRRCSNVSLLIPVGSSNSQNVCYEHVMSNVELTIVVEQWAVNVHLNDECTLLLLLLDLAWLRLWCCSWRGFWFWFWLGRFHYGVQFVDLVNNSDASALVRVLARFDNPNISGLFLAPVSLLVFHFLLFDLFASLLMIFAKSQVFRILHAIFNMKSQRYIIKDILFPQSVIFFQIMK